MFDDETIPHYKELLETYRRNLRHLLKQAAQYNGEMAAPVSIVNSLLEARAHIQQIKEHLRSLGEIVTNGASTAPRK